MGERGTRVRARVVRTVSVWPGAPAQPPDGCEDRGPPPDNGDGVGGTNGVPRPTVTYWAIGQDYGTEGQCPPLTLVRDGVEARAIMTLYNQMVQYRMYLVEVPVWPGVRETTEPAS